MDKTEKIRQILSEEPKSARKRLAEWSKTEEGRKAYEKIAEEMRSLDEKIAKAKKSWEGVDVDKYMDMVRGREPVSEELEEAADSAAIKAFPENKSYSTVVDRVVDYSAIDRKNYRDGFIAGAELPRQKDREKFAKIISRAWCEGFDACKEQLVKGAVEAVVTTNLANRPIIYLDQLQGFQYGDKVIVFVIKED